jgi:dienelactone hydrolase
MSASGRARAPVGDPSSYTTEQFSHAGVSHPVLRKGGGPAVVVLSEIPGITPMLLGFADRLVGMGCTAVLPHLFGTVGVDLFDRSPANLARVVAVTVRTCVSREFAALAAGRTPPVARWLRGLAVHEHARCGGPGVGVVGMCFTGGFALAMAVHPTVLAPVLSHPSLPVIGLGRRARSINCGDADLDAVARRCQMQGLEVLGLRFREDGFVPEGRFEFLTERLGDRFVAVELHQADGHPDGPLRHRHSVLTGDLIDEPGEATRAALDRVLELFRQRLLTRP